MTNSDHPPRKQAEAKTATAAWMAAHPNDKPCPADPHAARAWRKARGIGPNATAERRMWDKYHEAMREKRAREAAS